MDSGAGPGLGSQADFGLHSPHSLTNGMNGLHLPSTSTNGGGADLPSAGVGANNAAAGPSQSNGLSGNTALQWHRGNQKVGFLVAVWLNQLV